MENALHELVMEDSTPLHRAKKVPMIVVHCQEEELNYLDQMQGGTSIDQKTGLPEYSRLEKILKNPEVKALFQRVWIDLATNGKLDDGDVKEVVKETKPGPIKTTSHPLPTQLAKEFAKKGVLGDTKLALIPVKVADFFDSLRGGMDINPHTGLRQYGRFFKNLFRSVVRVVAPVVGFAVAGPAGAAIGGGLGQAVTGANAKKAITRGLGAGAMGIGANVLGGVLGSSAIGANGILSAPVGGLPGIATSIGSGVSTVGNKIGSIFGGSTGTALGGVGLGSAMANRGSTHDAAERSTGIFDHLFDPKNLLPAVWGGLKAKGAHDTQKQADRNFKEHNDSVEKMLRSYGY